MERLQSAKLSNSNDRKVQKITRPKILNAALLTDLLKVFNYLPQGLIIANLHPYEFDIALLRLIAYSY